MTVFEKSPFGCLVSLGQARPCHGFPKTALLNESLLQSPDLLIQEIVDHFDQSYDHVCTDSRVRMLAAFLEGLIVRAGRAVELAEALRMGMIEHPLLQTARAKKIAIVFHQLLLASARHVDSLEFQFLGGAGNLAAFHNVLLAGASRLHHLVMGLVAPVDETLAEVDRGVKNDHGLLIGQKLLIATVRRDESI